MSRRSRNLLAVVVAVLVTTAVVGQVSAGTPHGRVTLDDGAEAVDDAQSAGPGGDANGSGGSASDRGDGRGDQRGAGNGAEDGGAGDGGADNQGEGQQDERDEETGNEASGGQREDDDAGSHGAGDRGGEDSDAPAGGADACERDGPGQPDGPCDPSAVRSQNRTVGAPANGSARGGGYPAPPLNRTALAFRDAARTRLADANLSGGQRDRLLAELDGTYAAHLDADRIDHGRVFDADMRVAGPTVGRSPAVTGAIVAADAALAHTALRDAERVADELRARGIPFDEAAVEEQLAKARRALRQGDRLRGRAVGAVQHYRRAWAHAQRALDLMDEAVVPVVVTDTRSDVPHNSSIAHPVNGTVFDVRPYELNGTLTVTGTPTVDNRSMTVSLDASTVPGTVARYNASADLERQWPGPPAPVDRRYTLNVSVRDPGRDYAPTASDDFEPVHGPQLGADPVELDGDGLPDRYEAGTTGTDPLDPDSDSDRTDPDEAGDGLVDGAEDFDGDAVNTYGEFRAGLDPFDPDTDDDVLTDGFERQYPTLDPLAADTDANGTPDGAEDLDGDGLDNVAEQRHGANPVVADTDGDGLDDGRETDLGTDPLAVDTDADGLPDPEELALGTDPLVADTDGDGVPDGEETFTTSTANASPGVAVSVAGHGDVASGVSVANGSRPAFETDGLGAARASGFVELRSREVFESATLTIAYDAGAVADESDLMVFRHNASARAFEPVPSTVDAANDTVTAEVAGFSTFVVLSASAWASFYEGALPSRASESVDDFDGTDVTCEGTGACGTDDGVLTVGESSGTTTAATSSSFTTAELIDGGGGGGGDDECPDDDSDGSDDSDDSDDDDDGSSGGGGLIRPFSLIDGGGGGGGDDECPDDDADGDGIADGEDDCPETAGSAETNGCPDDDGDGIRNSADACPDAAGADATDGCPDRDDDGTRDGEDACPDDPASAEKPCFVVTATGPTLALPAGAEEVTVEVAFSADVPDDDSYVRVWLLADAGGTETVYARVSPGDTGGFVVRSADVSRFAGESVTLLVEKGGNATASVGSVDLILDSDGDGLTDREERDGFPTGYLETTTTSPFDADTDGDGLHDGEEIGPRVGYYYRLRSDPESPDTDGDGLDDFEELRVWESDPEDVDTDGDGYEDFPDPRNVVPDQVPDIVNVRTQEPREYVEFTVNDDSMVAVSSNPRYNPSSPFDEPYWDSSKASVIDLGAGRYRIEFEDHGLLNEGPERYWVNVTDAQGNSRVVEIDVKESGGYEIASAGVAIGTVVSTPKTDPLPEELIGIAILGASAAALYATAEYVGVDHSVIRRELLTAEAARFQAADTALASDVVLVTGGVEGATDPRVAETIYHGHGWRLIQALLPELTKRDVGSVLRNPNAIERFGEDTFVIGDNPLDSGQLVIQVRDGMIVNAFSGQIIRDPLSREIIIDRNNRHPVTNTDVDYDEIEQVIRNPDQIWRGDRMDHYVKKINGKVVIVRVFKHLDRLEVSTAVVHRTVQAAREYIEVEWGLKGNQIYGSNWDEL